MKDSPFFDKLINKSDEELERMLQNEQSFDNNAIKVSKYILEERKNCADYTTYTFADLMDVDRNINKEKYPVRSALLYNEIKKRKQSEEYFNQREDQKNILKKNSIVINPRLRLKFEKSDLKGKKEEIELDQLKDYLIKPSYGELIKISDSSVDLLIIFDTNDNQYGFSFEYLNKDTNDYFKSKLHGLSEEFSISFIRDFIEKGKSELELLDWKKHNEVKSRITVFMVYVYAVIVLITSLSMEFKIDPIFKFITEHRDTFIKPFFYFLIFVSILNIYSTREQFMHLAKLTTREKFDTIISLFFPFLFAAIIYFKII